MENIRNSMENYPEPLILQIMGLNQGVFYENLYGDIIEGSSLSVEQGFPPKITHFNGYLINPETGERKQKINYNFSQTSVDSILPLPQKRQKELRKMVESKLEKSAQTPPSRTSEPGDEAFIHGLPFVKL